MFKRIPISIRLLAIASLFSVNFALPMVLRADAGHCYACGRPLGYPDSNPADGESYCWEAVDNQPGFKECDNDVEEPACGQVPFESSPCEGLPTGGF